MAFEIQQLSWHKRRRPSHDPKPIDIDVPDFKKEANHICQISVTFDNGEILEMTGRVLQNPVTGAWSVSGINTSGQSVFAKYLED